MLLRDTIGQEFIKNHLKVSVDSGRIAHAQLFVGKAGAGVLPMAIAYAQHILCGASGENRLNLNNCHLKFENLTHPDLHFSFPTATTPAIKSNPVSSLFMSSWRSFIKEKPYGNLYDWHQYLGIEKKQAQISVNEATLINKTLALKSYEGGYKIMIIWAADKVNTAAANKLLKLIEEPPDKTLFILITEHEDHIIDTIKSRCQILHFPNLTEPQIAEALVKEHHTSEEDAKKIAQQAQGDYQKAIDLLHSEGEDALFETWFIEWVRTAFQASRKKDAILGLIAWSDTIAKTGRETQKSFLEFCVHIFRQAMLLNYKAHDLVYIKSQNNFDLSKFAPFVHNNNIMPIVTAIQDASYHIQRNGNAKIILTDLSIKLTRLLHKKS